MNSFIFNSISKTDREEYISVTEIKKGRLSFDFVFSFLKEILSFFMIGILSGISDKVNGRKHTITSASLLFFISLLKEPSEQCEQL